MRSDLLSKQIADRTIEAGYYIADNNATIRETAKKFGLSKSVVFVDVAKRLQYIDFPLSLRVREVLDYNKLQRHLRGGAATRMKYKKAS